MIKKNNVFFISISISIFIIIVGLIFHNQMPLISNWLMEFVSINFGWLYILYVFVVILFLFYLFFSKYGKIKLGKDEDKPEYSNFQWYSMLFCGGTGIGLVFWSIAEPLSHYTNAPFGIESFSKEAMNFSIRTCFLHWGVTQWACFAIVGLALAYFQYRKEKECLISSVLSPILKINNNILKSIIDIFSIIVSVAGIATSLGLGVMQFSGGLNYLFGIPMNEIIWLICILIITIIFISSAISGVNKGIKFLSQINTIIAFLLLSIAFCIGPKLSILNNLINGMGQHLQYFFEDILKTDAFGDNSWIINWRIFYYAWFIAWTPFVGMFIARISKGRTIKEFIFGVIIIPTIFTIIWMSVFSTIAFNVSDNWGQDELRAIVTKPETAVFNILNKYSYSNITSILIIILLAIFFITSADSATYSLSVMSSNGQLNPKTNKKITWGIIEALMAFSLLSVGSLKPLQTISIAFSLPFLFIMILIIPSLLMEFKNEKDTH